MLQVQDIRARSCKNVSYAICEQQRCRSACASAQSDQHLCCSLLKQYDIYTCYIQSFKILASFCSWAGWFESYPIENPRRHIFTWWGSYNTSRAPVVTVPENLRRKCCDFRHVSRNMTKPTMWLCAQRRLTSAWASALSDQSLRCALNG